MKWLQTKGRSYIVKKEFIVKVKKFRKVISPVHLSLQNAQGKVTPGHAFRPIQRNGVERFCPYSCSCSCSSCACELGKIRCSAFASPSRCGCCCVCREGFQSQTSAFSCMKVQSGGLWWAEKAVGFNRN